MSVRNGVGLKLEKQQKQQQVNLATDHGCWKRWGAPVMVVVETDRRRLGPSLLQWRAAQAIWLVAPSRHPPVALHLIQLTLP